MPYFDRFDICSAYNLYATLWGGDGAKYENAIQCRLSALDFRASRSEESPEGLSENAQDIYLALIAREQGSEAFEQERAEIRPETRDLVVRLETSSCDPMQITVDVSGPTAHAWADNDQTIAGASWETARDMPEYAYTVLSWYPTLIADLKKDGYRLDLSEYNEPTADEIAIAIHASECDECSWDYQRAEEHCAQ